MKRVIKKTKEKMKHSGIFLFIGEMLRNFRAVGAACPSSKKLARSMAAQVPEEFDGLVVELGAGTGVITAALLEKDISTDHIIVVEQSKPLAKHLQNRFPELKVIEGDASHLETLLGEDKDKVTVVVSSLPFRSLPHETVSAIENELTKILKPGGLFIQFTYSLGNKSLPFSDQFKHIYSETILLNIPPARLDVFQRC